MIPIHHHVARVVNRQSWFDNENQKLNEQAFMRNRNKEPSISVLHYEQAQPIGIFNISDKYIYTSKNKLAFGFGKVAVVDVHKCSENTKVKPSPSKNIASHCDILTQLEDQVLASLLAEYAIWIPRP